MLEIPTQYLDSTWRHFNFSEIFDHDFDDLMASTNNEDGIKEMKNKLECTGFSFVNTPMNLKEIRDIP